MNTQNAVIKPKREFYIDRVEVKEIDSYTGEWYTSRDAEILIERGDYESYLTNNESIFDYSEKAVANGENVKIEIFTLVSFNEEDVDTMKRVFGLELLKSMKFTIYNKVQHYGGAEEGGWYYHNLYLTDYNYSEMSEEEREELLDTDQHGEGYVMYEEYYRGQNEKTAKEYYC
jgi:hypothetical protein